MSGNVDRPAAVTRAIWLLIGGAVLVAAGGMVTAAVSFDTLRQVAAATVPDDMVRSTMWLYRGVGALFVLASAGLVFVAWRTRGGDVRFRRATTALSLAVVVVVSLSAVLVGTHILALLGVLPILLGIVLLGRPAAVEWFAGHPGAGTFDDRTFGEGSKYDV